MILGQLRMGARQAKNASLNIEKVEIWSGVSIPDRQTNKQGRKDRATQAPEK